MCTKLEGFVIGMHTLVHEARMPHHEIQGHLHSDPSIYHFHSQPQCRENCSYNFMSHVQQF